MPNANLAAAKAAKNDEFYTRYRDIGRELSRYYERDRDFLRGKVVLCPCDDPEWSEFTRYLADAFGFYGLKKLICTSYAGSLVGVTDWQRENGPYDPAVEPRGKVMVLDRDLGGDGRVGRDDFRWEYLEGDGDFRSDEVTALRDEADVIITNPPFSLFREFLAWTMEGEKQFIVLGNKNAITYKETFPLIKDNKLWLGVTSPSEFLTATGEVTKQASGLTRWFTNIPHGKRNEPLVTDKMEYQLRFNRPLRRILENKFGQTLGRGADGELLQHFPRYDNYDAIEVPRVDAIPCDYDGVMGVPITFLDRYDPDQFEIIGRTGDLEWCENECPFYMPPSDELQKHLKQKNRTWRVQNAYFYNAETDSLEMPYGRLFIRKRPGFQGGN